jgi:hypothetical protein
MGLLQTLLVFVAIVAILVGARKIASRPKAAPTAA